MTVVPNLPSQGAVIYVVVAVSPRRAVWRSGHGRRTTNGLGIWRPAQPDSLVPDSLARRGVSESDYDGTATRMNFRIISTITSESGRFSNGGAVPATTGKYQRPIPFLFARAKRVRAAGPLG